MSIPGGITREHIVAAALRLDAGEPHGFGQANTWNVVIDGRHYAPKQVIGVAARIGLGLELAPGDFSGGEAPGGTNRYLRDLGFEIVPIPEAAEMSHENLDTAGVVASPRVRDILRVLTRLPVARGQVGFLKMLREAGESGVAAAEIQGCGAGRVTTSSRFATSTRRSIHAPHLSRNSDSSTGTRTQTALAGSAAPA